MPDKAIFFDPSRRRWPWIKRIGTLLGLLAAIVASAFLISVFTTPLLPGLPGITMELKRTLIHGVHLPRRQNELDFLKKRDRDRLFAHIGKEQEVEHARAARPLIKANDVVAAFYAPWHETPGIYSLRANARYMTHLLPVWVRLRDTSTGAKPGLDFQDWNPEVNLHNKDVLQIARENNLNILPVLSNAQQSDFDPKRAHQFLTDPGAQSRSIIELRNWLTSNRFQGLNVDFENLVPEDYPLLVSFLRRLRKAFAPAGLLVTADLEARKPIDFKAVAAVCDFVIVMAYDEHASVGPPGPIASIKWYRETLEQAASKVPRNKLVIGIGNYSYDWTAGNNWAEPLTYQQALVEAKRGRPGEPIEKIVDFDAEYLNPTFWCIGADGREHEVWMLDAVTAANQWTIAQNYRLRGAAIWVLGMTDPSIWKFIRRDRLNRRVNPLSISSPLKFPEGAPEFVGEGEILHVAAEPEDGERTLEVEPRTGMIVDEVYSKFPTSYVIDRTGYKEKAVALTIDDGPASPYTAEMLDILRQHGVKATFFLIGENAERYPGLVRRIWNEGHEIGNHSYTHPNIGVIPPTRARLELNSTQRVFQSLLRRSTLLFRPPYNADAEPSSRQEVEPIALATSLNYVTVGEFVDPLDWMTEVHTPDGSLRKRTAEEMYAIIEPQLQVEHGNCVLLHDGGGDRDESVRLLRMMVERLPAKGYRFVTVSQLIDSTRDAVNPPVGGTDTFMLASDRIVFEALYLFELFLTVTFISGIILGTLRVVFVTVLAFIGRRREKRMVFDGSFTPSVSVVIAAYNEERVIARTIDAVLDNDYPDLEIIVVDDGSKDGTFAEVERVFGTRVHLLHQENAGKAAALNRGFALARGEIIIALDADTIFARDTIRKLVRRFNDPLVGAVAGNVKVGNRINPLTYWQAIEYITSQNLDRRAYAVINAVTVVPGAVGAWRREAVLQASGYTTDTMAEDMDLTWRIRRIGWRVATDTEAFGYTEAPASFRQLFRQRFRWAFGTLQCLWKHRRALGRYEWFGKVMLPALWLFQVGYQAISPLVDLQIIWSVAEVVQAWARSHSLREWETLPQALASLSLIAFMYAFFFVIELVGSLVAFKLDRENPKMLVWLFWQRFLYRQLMYAVLLKSIKTAVSGMRTGWGKLDRKGTVELAIETPGS